MKDTCFFKEEEFCYYFLSKTFSCDNCKYFKKRLCKNCNSFILKTCNGEKSICKDFKRKKGWVWDLEGKPKKGEEE